MVDNNNNNNNNNAGNANAGGNAGGNVIAAGGNAANAGNAGNVPGAGVAAPPQVIVDNRGLGTASKAKNPRAAPPGRLSIAPSMLKNVRNLDQVLQTHSSLLDRIGIFADVDIILNYNRRISASYSAGGNAIPALNSPDDNVCSHELYQAAVYFLASVASTELDDDVFKKFLKVSDSQVDTAAYTWTKHYFIHCGDESARNHVHVDDDTVQPEIRTKLFALKNIATAIQNNTERLGTNQHRNQKTQLLVVHLFNDTVEGKEEWTKTTTVKFMPFSSILSDFCIRAGVSVVSIPRPKSSWRALVYTIASPYTFFHHLASIIFPKLSASVNVEDVKTATLREVDDLITFFESVIVQGNPFSCDGVCSSNVKYARQAKVALLPAFKQAAYHLISIVFGEDARRAVPSADQLAFWYGSVTTHLCPLSGDFFQLINDASVSTQGSLEESKRKLTCYSLDVRNVYEKIHGTKVCGSDKDKSDFKQSEDKKKAPATTSASNGGPGTPGGKAQQRQQLRDRYQDRSYYDRGESYGGDYGRDKHSREWYDDYNMFTSPRDNRNRDDYYDYDQGASRGAGRGGRGRGGDRGRGGSFGPRGRF